MTSDAVKSLRIDRATRGPDRRGRGGGARWCAVVCCAGVRASSANNEIRGQVFTDSERNDLPQTDDTSIPDRRACQPRLPEQSADLFETTPPCINRYMLASFFESNNWPGFLYRA